MNLLRRFAEDRKGNMAILFAVALGASAVVSAFATDAAALYNERRHVQGAVDLAALAAARDPSNGLQIARQALGDAGLIGGSVALADLTAAAASTRLAVSPGHYQADPAIAPDQRFVAGQQPYNAVRVRFEQPGTLFFARTWSPIPVLSAAAIATIAPQVSFSAGSRLASLSGGIVNGVLDGLLGSNVALTAADYNALLTAKVDLFGFMDALAQQLHVTAGSYDDLLRLRVTHGQLAAALVNVLAGPEKLAAQKLANTLGHDGTLALADFLSLGQFGRLGIGGTGNPLSTGLSALHILAASAGLSDGSHQVALNLTAGVPAPVGIAIELAVGKPAQGGSFYAIGPNQTVVRTSQARVRLAASLSGGPVLLNGVVYLPLYLELAPTEAMVSSATCPTASAPRGTAVIATRPGVARLTLGEIDSIAMGDFGGTPGIGLARLIDLLLLKVSGSAVAEIGQVTPVALSFSSTDIANGTVKTARSQQVAASLAGTLLANLNLNVAVPGLGLAAPAAITATLNLLLAPLAPTLDLTIATLLQALGLGVGEADIEVYGVTCINPVLVG